MPRHVVATADEIAPGERKVVTVDGRDVAVFNVGGAYFGVLNRCPHQGGSLCNGQLYGHVTSDEPGTVNYERPGAYIRCPWHGWFFDLKTGQSWGEPQRLRTRSYEVGLAGGGQLAEGPYTAETVEVQAEGAYLIIET